MTAFNTPFFVFRNYKHLKEMKGGWEIPPSPDAFQICILHINRLPSSDILFLITVERQVPGWVGGVTLKLLEVMKSVGAGILSLWSRELPLGAQTFLQHARKGPVAQEQPLGQQWPRSWPCGGGGGQRRSEVRKDKATAGWGRADLPALPGRGNSSALA